MTHSFKHFHAVTSLLEENSMGGNLTTPKQALVAYCQLGMTTSLL